MKDNGAADWIHLLTFRLLLSLFALLRSSRDKSAYTLLGTHWSRTLGAHVAVINYRLSSSSSAAAAAAATAAPVAPAVLHPAHTDDSLAALRWLADPAVQQAHSFSTDAIFIVGHSCGAHIAGLIALAEPPSTLLTGLDSLLNVDPSAAAAASPSPLPLLRGCIGVEGIFDCARFVADFPSWSSGIGAAFSADESLWESPQDYLPALPNESDSASRARVQAQLAGAASKRRTASPPWLVVHSTEDPWVNLPQAERFHAALLARPGASASSSSTLLLVSGTHFEVVERVGAPLDELTKPIGEFVQRCMQTASL
jgi:acetyl esterase/lipase